jgi:type II secretory pathway component GspD/PulD (secretin)
VIVPEVTSNSLLVSSTSEYMKQITAMIGQLDKTPQQIQLDLVIQEVDAEGKVKILSEPTVITIEGRKATLELSGVTRNTLRIELTPKLVEKIGAQ